MNEEISTNELASFILEKAQKTKINAENICIAKFGDKIIKGNSFRVALSTLEEYRLIKQPHPNKRVIDISPRGKEILEKHGSFSKYLSDLEHDERKALETKELEKKKDRKPVWVAAGISLLGVIASVGITFYGVRSLPTEKKILELELRLDLLEKMRQTAPTIDSNIEIEIPQEADSVFLQESSAP